MAVKTRYSDSRSQPTMTFVVKPGGTGLPLEGDDYWVRLPRLG